jgi:hypothetical protein
MLSPLLVPRERKRIDLAQKNIAQSSWYFVASPTLAFCPRLDRRTKTRSLPLFSSLLLSSYAATTFAMAASKGRLMRCTVLGSTPNRFIFRTPSVRPGAFRAARIRTSRSAAMRWSPNLFSLGRDPARATRLSLAERARSLASLASAKVARLSSEDRDHSRDSSH